MKEKIIKFLEEARKRDKERIEEERKMIHLMFLNSLYGSFGNDYKKQ